MKSYEEDITLSLPIFEMNASIQRTHRTKIYLDNATNDDDKINHFIFIVESSHSSNECSYIFINKQTTRSHCFIE